MAPIDIKEAFEIAKDAFIKGYYFAITEQPPTSEFIYRTDEECWYVYVSDLRHHQVGGRRVICISKNTGEILSDGMVGE